LIGSFPVPVISVVALVVCAAIVVAGLGVSHMLTAQPAADATPNPNCTLIVPANPLTARGLATPYQFTATDAADGPCNEANDGQTAFVQGAVINTVTGKISIYNPLVVDEGTKPAVAPMVPRLPAHAVVAVWFGYNGNTLTLAGADQVSSTPSATPTDSTTPATPATSATPTGYAPQTTSASSTASSAATAKASVESEGSAPLPPGSGTTARWFYATLTKIGGSASARHHPSPSPTVTKTTTATATPTSTPTSRATRTASPAASVSAAAIPSGNPADSPAASPAKDALLTGANCVAGEDFAGDFSSFTQVGACNAVAFFAAANRAIRVGKLRVPAPGTAVDGRACLTTRSFALIDQDQSDNVTTEYLSTSNGQIAQDTAANRNTLTGAATIFNGSDNGLLDLFVDPALGCSPWETRNLADNGAPAPALPLDEIQAAAWAGRQGSGPSAIVPLNDPMTLDNDGQFSTDKTNTYRSIVDMKPLPAGESPRAYCSDLERIQGARIQQDVNLLTRAPSPVPGAADNLFDFLAMRLQQSFTNLNCGEFGQANDVSTTVDGNGVVVASCFVHQVGAITSGPGNQTAGMTNCPATTTAPSPSASASQPSGIPPGKAKGYYHHHHHG
jgi:hypothetical protein